MGVSPQSLRAWEQSGKISPVYTPGGHRRYKLSDIEEARNNETQAPASVTRVAVYCRTSSHEQKQKGDLERQKGRVLQYCVDKKYNVIEVFEEVGSGMSDSRAKLKKVFKLIEDKAIDKVVVEHKDRLCRFMFDFLVAYFASHNVEIEWMSDVLGKTYEQELVEDMLSLMSSFSNRIYGKRSAENKRLRKLAETSNV